jgi:hypothetical protein
MLRHVTAAVGPGGIIAFMEPALHADFLRAPEIELLRAVDSIVRFHRKAVLSPDIAGRFIPCFLDAGLPEPTSCGS